MNDITRDSIESEVDKIFKLARLLIPKIRGKKDVKWDVCHRSCETYPKYIAASQGETLDCVQPETVIMQKWVMLTEDGALRVVRMGYSETTNTLIIRDWRIRELSAAYVLDPSADVDGNFFVGCIGAI